MKCYNSEILFALPKTSSILTTPCFEIDVTMLLMKINNFGKFELQSFFCFKLIFKVIFIKFIIFNLYQKKGINMRKCGHAIQRHCNDVIQCNVMIRLFHYARQLRQ